MVVISFKVDDTGKIINVKYEGEWTIEQLMRHFTKNNTSYESIDQNIYTFKVGAKILNMDKFKTRKVKDIIQDQTLVKFVRKQNMSYSN